MSRSEVQFDRWKPRDPVTWAFQVFKQYTIEYKRNYTTFINAKEFTYNKLKYSASASLTDHPSKFFKQSYLHNYDKFKDMKDWSKSFNDLENWLNLNYLLAMTSSLETYIATVVSLALHSDIGILYGVSKRIDGIALLKHGSHKRYDFNDEITNCTKGTWEKRVNWYERIFQSVPNILKNNISELEKIRNLRNDISHAFGREINASHDFSRNAALPITTLKVAKLVKMQDVTWKVAKAIDDHLHMSHIGEYQALHHYHTIYPEMNKEIHSSMRAIELKKRLGRRGSIPLGKEFCKGLVLYYENL